MAKKLKNKKIYLMMLLAIVLALLMIAIIQPFSKSEPVITLKCSNLLMPEQAEITATLEVEQNNEGQNTIVLPEIIDDKIVVAYYIEVETEEENNTENPEENNEENYEELEPGSTYILTEEEFSNGIIRIKAFFNENVEEEYGGISQVATTTFSGGNGSSSSPYEISTKEDMDNLASVVNNYTKDTANNKYYTVEYYKLTNDIDYEGSAITPIGKIDASSTNYSFQGVFDGNGYTIKNGNITIEDQNLSEKGKYGIFASTYSTNSSKRATIKNLEVDNVHIYNNTTEAAPKDMVYGILVGITGRYSSIVNCIIKNSSIEFADGFVLGNEMELAIGGLTGDIVKDATTGASTAVLSLDEQNIIENCYVDVDITVPDTNWAENGTSTRYYQYVIGGIVGRIRSQEKFPSHCIYTGTITSSKAFIGPIYANLRYGEIPKSFDNYMKSYLAINKGGSSVGIMEDSYFYNYKINNGQLHSIGPNYKSELSAETLDDITAYTLDLGYMGKVQGVNRGEYISSIEESASFFNNYTGVGSTYNTWYYDHQENQFSFKEISNEYEVNIVKNATHNYTMESNIQDSEGVTYNWYVDNVLQDETSDTITVTYGDITQIRNLKCELLMNGEIIAIKTIIIDVEELNLTLFITEENGQEKLELELSSSMAIAQSDYTYKWYKASKDSAEFVLITTGTNGSECQIANGTQVGDKYKLVAEHNANTSYDREVIYIYNKVIYVNYTTLINNASTYPEGDDNNNGRTPEKAVKTLEKAYELLSAEKTEEENIIVIMGDYPQYLSDNTFIKPATLTGTYLDINWNGNIYLNKSGINPDYNATKLNADTIFKDISLDCDNQNQFIYCQGNNLTMDKNIIISNYTKGKVEWGLPNTNYSGLSIFGGWVNYNESIEIPNDVCNITIKSGCYGRILGGSRNDGTKNNNASYCFGSLDKPFNVVITIDIENDDENKGTLSKSIGALIGGQSDGNCCINNVINLVNGSVEKLYGGNLGYGREYPNKPSDSFWGSTKLNLIGGTIESIFGASYGRISANVDKQTQTYFYGKIEINLTGTKINNSLYGAGAGGVTGYYSESTDEFKDWVINRTMTDIDGKIYRLDKTTTTINISDSAEINGSVYGGGYGYSFALTENQLIEDGGSFYGDVFININGGTIKGNVYGGGCGTEEYETIKKHIASMIGNVQLNISDDPRIEGSIYGGGKGSNIYSGMGSIEGNVTVNIEDALLGNYIVTDVYGGGEGYSANVTGNTTITIKDTEVSGNIYGGGFSADVSGNTNIKIENSAIKPTNNTKDGNERGGEVYGGGEGEQSIVNGSTYVEIDNSEISTRVCGGGDSGQVLSGTDVYVHGGSKVLKAVYGGGNGTTGSVGTEESPANTIVLVEDAIIGNVEVSETGEVFGGGNYGTVYGNTNATIGNTNPSIETTINHVFYAGGRGETGATTVFGNSNAYILGVNTELGSYGNTSLGEVAGNVNITFEDFRSKSATHKYKYMSGINKATNLYLEDSYIYLTGGLIDITNLYVPTNSGIMISDDSQILGDFFGGGDLYLQNEVCLTIDGNMYDDTTSETKTTLTLNPAFTEEEGCYIIKGNSHSPYIKVLGNDFSSGIGIVSGETSIYTIYSLNKDDNPLVDRYNTTSTSFESMHESDENGEKYKSSVDPSDNRVYYKEIIGDTERYYTLTYDLELAISDSIYYIEKDIIVSSYTAMNIFSEKDKVYYSDITETENIYILSNGAFSTNINVLFTMTKDVEGNFIDSDGFENVKRSIYLTNNGMPTLLPVGTIITMISDNTYYTYTIGDEEVQNISLESFVGENGNYEEIENIKENAYQLDEIVASKWGLEENFRFIIDFSECESYLDNGSYDIILKLEEENDGEIQEIYTNVNNNSIIINNRSYEATVKAEKEEYTSFDNIKLEGNLKLKELSTSNTCDIGKDIVAVINLKDNQNRYVNLPKGTVVTVDEQEYNIDDEIIVKLIENLEQKKYSKDFNISLNLSGIPELYRLSQGDYILEIKFYLSEEDVLIGNKELISKEVTFSIREESNYGIKITSINKKMGQRDDEVQLITSLEDSSKTVNIQYIKGNLDADGTYIIAKTYKRELDGSFTYFDMNVTIAENQRIQVSRNQNVEYNLTFDESMENGTYRIVYELVNKDEQILTSTYVNFTICR